MGENFAGPGPAFFGAVGAAHCAQFRVGGVAVRVEAESRRDVALCSSLEPFRVEAGVSDIEVQIHRAARFPDTHGRQLFDSGSVWRLYDNEGGFRFDFSTPPLGVNPYKRLIVDRDFRHASLLISDECFARRASSIAPLDYPLDELLIMHRLTREKAIELHSCGIVGPDGTGNLFVGHSGAGKSTTTRLWTEREGVEVLSDDRIIVRRDDVRRGADTSVTVMPRGGAGGGERVGVLRLRDCSASRNSHFAQDDIANKRCSAQDDMKKRMRMYGTPWHGEAMYASPGTAELARIFLLEHGCGNVLTQLSASQAVAELFARSFVPFHRHEYVESALEFLEEVVDAVPCYRYAFEPDQRAVDTILNLHD